MESTYPRTEPRPTTSWVVDILAAILATVLAMPLLMVLILPRLSGVFMSLGNDRSVGVSSYFVVSIAGWCLIGLAFAGVVGLTIYLRTRGPAGPRLNVKRVIWLSIGLCFALAAFMVFSVLQAVFSAGDVVK